MENTYKELVRDFIEGTHNTCKNDPTNDANIELRLTVVDALKKKSKLMVHMAKKFIVIVLKNMDLNKLVTFKT